MNALTTGLTAEIDSANQLQWSTILQDFSDANIFQTWSYGVARSGRTHVSRVVLKRDGRPVAAAQARLAGLVDLRIGIAYVRWGPVWKQRSSESDPEIFRNIVRAIRNEYAMRRGLVVRLLPPLCTDETQPYGRILEEEGYVAQSRDLPYRTILMDVRPTLDDIAIGFHQKWRKHLNRARKNSLEIIEGEQDHFLEALGLIYKEMVERKKLSGKSDISIYRRAQQFLAPAEKMTAILCKSQGEVVAGALFSVLGDTAVDLYRATSDRGINTYGSYLVQWSVLESLKRRGCQWYNLNGINPVSNPGGYQFKSQLAGKNGRDVCFLRPFDVYPNTKMKLLVRLAERLRDHHKGTDLSLRALFELLGARKSSSHTKGIPAP